MLIDTRLGLIEGIMGSGKSNLTVFVSGLAYAIRIIDRCEKDKISDP